MVGLGLVQYLSLPVSLSSGAGLYDGQLFIRNAQEFAGSQKCRMEQPKAGLLTAAGKVNGGSVSHSPLSETKPSLQSGNRVLGRSGFFVPTLGCHSHRGPVQSGSHRNREAWRWAMPCLSCLHPRFHESPSVV